MVVRDAVQQHGDDDGVIPRFMERHPLALEVRQRTIEPDKPHRTLLIPHTVEMALAVPGEPRTYGVDLSFRF